jgi:hypothetical protein
MSGKTFSPGAATSAIAQVVLKDIVVDEGLPPRRDGLEHVWTDWLQDSTPGIGPPAALQAWASSEAMRATT